jgi:hypothetical protein
MVLYRPEAARPAAVEVADAKQAEVAEERPFLRGLRP